MRLIHHSNVGPIVAKDANYVLDTQFVVIRMDLVSDYNNTCVSQVMDTQCSGSRKGLLQE